MRFGGLFMKQCGEMSVTFVTSWGAKCQVKANASEILGFPVDGENVLPKPVSRLYHISWVKFKFLNRTCKFQKRASKVFAASSVFYLKQKAKIVSFVLSLWFYNEGIGLDTVLNISQCSPRYSSQNSFPLAKNFCGQTVNSELTMFSPVIPHFKW